MPLFHSGATVEGLQVINSIDPSVLKFNYYIVIIILGDEVGVGEVNWLLMVVIVSTADELLMMLVSLTDDDIPKLLTKVVLAAIGLLVTDCIVELATATLLVVVSSTVAVIRVVTAVVLSILVKED